MDIAIGGIGDEMSNRTLFAALGLLFGASLSHASGITGGNLIVTQAGDGAAALSSAAAAGFIQEFTTSGSLVQTIALPTSVSGSNRRLVFAGSATSEGHINLSGNGLFASVAGYDANVGTATIATSTAAAANRVVGLLNLATGTVNSSTAFDALYSGNNLRSSFSTNGTDNWTTGSGGGIAYTATGATTGQGLIS